jgi:hypothetical protein
MYISLKNLLSQSSLDMRHNRLWRRFSLRTCALDGVLAPVALGLFPFLQSAVAERAPNEANFSATSTVSTWEQWFPLRVGNKWVYRVESRDGT